MKNGVCPITRGARYQIILDEPIVARAAENHFGLVSSSFALIRQLKDTPKASAMGLEFDGTTRLEEHELLRSVPGVEAFKGVWKMANRSDAQGRTLACVATQPLLQVGRWHHRCATYVLLSRK